MHIIKQVPEDFRVVEQIRLDLKEDGKYSIYRLTKRDFSTFRAIDLIAQSLKIKHRFVGFAGNKDKMAVTVQYISLPRDKRPSINGEKLKLEFVGNSSQPISLGDLDRNHFEIIIRNLEGSEALKPVSTIPNYFDEQRFSLQNVVIGRSLLKRDFKRALQLIIESSKTEDRMIKSIKENIERYRNDSIGALRKIPLKHLRFYLHSYQSYLFNETLAEYILARAVKLRELKYSLGTLVFPEEPVENRELPILGFSTPLYQKDYLEMMQGIIDDEKINARDFIIRELPEISSEGGTRNAFAEVEDMRIGLFEEDELNQGMKKLKLTFSLPKGSYATIAIKSIMGISS